MSSTETEKGRSKPPVRKKSKPAGVLREDCFHVLDENNRVVDKKNDPKLDKQTLLKMYRNMVVTRVFDERSMMLQRQGRIGFSVPSFGQEAIQTGTAMALRDSDWVFPSYREPGVFLWRGTGLYPLFCNLYGNKEDVCRGRQMPVHYSFADKRLFSISSPISTQVIQAVGAAMASKIRGDGDVAITYMGDGGTSENDFHTGMTFAGAMKAPTVFVCTNNQYAISVPVHKQTGAKRMVDKAVGYGMPGRAVDGNDVLASYVAAKEAVEHARSGKGPYFLEYLTLRIGPHSSSDDPTRYRDPEQYEAWKKRDPIVRLREYMEHEGHWSKKDEETLQEEVKKEVLEAIARAEKVGPPEIEDLFDDVYADRIPLLERQREALIQERELRGKFENTSEAFPL